MNSARLIKQLTLVIGFILVSAACTGGKKKAIITPERSAKQSGEVIAIPVQVATLDETEIRQKANTQTATLSYRFTYLTYAKSDVLTFNAGKATLAFSGLPANQSGDMVLEISDGLILKLRGSAAAVTLKSGQTNVVNIVVAAVSPGNGGGNGNTGMTNVNVNVSFDNLQTLPPATGTVVTTDWADWDGKSHRGNSVWDVVPVL